MNDLIDWFNLLRTFLLSDIVPSMRVQQWTKTDKDRYLIELRESEDITAIPLHLPLDGLGKEYYFILEKLKQAKHIPKGSKI